MTRSASPSRSSAARPTRRPAPVVPNQHGAWAFLLLPVVLGSTRTGFYPLVLLLTAAWVAAYPLSWALSGWLTARRPERFVRALALWSPVTVLLGLPVLVLRPWLVWVLAGYGVLFAVNLSFARRRAERTLGNDLLLVAECTAMVPVVVAVGEGGRTWVPPWSAVTEPGVGLLAVVCLLALVGSVLHVKSLIRERRDPRYARASRVFAVGCVPAVGLLALVTGRPPGMVLGVVLAFGLLAARAFLVGARMRPARVGLVELAGLVVVALAVALTPG